MTIYSSYLMIVTPLDAVKITVTVLWDMHFLETVEKEEFTIKNPSNVLILMNQSSAEDQLQNSSAP